MSILVKIRRGEGPLWRSLKQLAKRLLTSHIPVRGPLRTIYGLLYRVHVVGRESALWLLRFFWFEPLFRSRCYSVGSRFRMEQLPYMTGCGHIEIGEGVHLSGKSSIGFNNRIHSLPRLLIGDETFIGHQCTFSIAQAIIIGRHCLVAGEVRVQDQDGHPLDASLRRQGEPVSADMIRPVKIGDDVWIGAGAVILKGVSIGDRAIVAARSVVTRDVPADVVVAGNPARIVKNLSSERAISAFTP